ncbi:hypothetical protein [Pseudobacteriovorax antillogorgiicola]|uniref:Outer membrane protein beta-barrel domain-containing protein n=1 Tax=Pseudobacteriovorax antillogorgiicola TaxID=1513793 RepID=A0A1Y6BM30_9BACT|nr:hypothetical protein [Pseudobacteriovorax antillogorgiicola]TCS54513.1 hypothetical protein EDD56_10626 [Pseudobacteriovorax antillogorgiicola]SMF18934.1 hypothetical protein SAMN06296036_106217 [Pseudobacteriovorax antillogorgiicola]
MKKLALLGLLIGSTCLSQNGTQEQHQEREFALQFSGSIGKDWGKNEDYTYASESISIYSSLLKLQNHFHYGFTAGISRSRPVEGSGNTSASLGLIAKWTLNDIQTAEQTPYISATASKNKSTADNSFYETKSDQISLGLGYEIFLNKFVSFQPEISMTRRWNHEETNWYDGNRDQVDVGKEDDVGFRFGLGIYI